MKEIVRTIIENIIYVIILVPLAVITILFCYQIFFLPENIPNIFGYKFFIVLDDKMEDSLEYGDIAITYNTPIQELKVNDIIAFRNGMNTVTIHKIKEISENNNEDNKKSFIMNAIYNETNYTKYVDENRIEGLVVSKIPKIGAIIFFIQQPLNMVIISLIILCIGEIWIYFARKLDQREFEQKK